MSKIRLLSPDVAIFSGEYKPTTRLTHMPIILLRSCVVFLTLFFVSKIHADTSKQELVFGVHPFQKPAKIYSMFQPIVDNMSKSLKRPIIIVIGKSYDDVLEQYKSKKIDIGYLGPVGYTRAHDEFGVIPLARILPNGKGTFKAMILVKQDSRIMSMADFVGKRFAFGDPESTLSHYLPHDMLIQAGIPVAKLETYAFVGNHDNIALSVINGSFDGGGVMPDIGHRYLPKGLRLLSESESVPEHVFVARGTLDKKTADEITRLLLKMDANILKNIKTEITGLEVAKDEDYNGLRKIVKRVDGDPIKY